MVFGLSDAKLLKDVNMTKINRFSVDFRRKTQLKPFFKVHDFIVFMGIYAMFAENIVFLLIR